MPRRLPLRNPKEPTVANVNLTPDNIETQPPPESGKPPILYRDEGMDGMLILRVSSTGSRSWVIEAKNGVGKEVQKAFGKYPSMGLAEARRSISRLEAEIAASGPQTAAKAAPKTLRGVFDDWKRSTHPKDTTSTTYENVLNSHARDWWDRPLRAIAREEVIDRCEKVWGRGSLRQGDQLFQTIRSLANHAEIVPNPGARIKPRSKKEDVEGARPLAPEVLAALFDGLEVLTTEAQVYYTVLLFTGFRSLGAKAMRWQYVKLGARPSYTITKDAPGFKKGGGWEFPLPEYLGDVLARYKRYHDRVKCGVDFLFPGEAGNLDSHQQRTDGSRRSLRKHSGLPGLRDNDFRDTYASYIQALYQRNYVTERLLDHRAGGTNVGAADVGFLYATAIPASVDMSAQLQLAAVDQGEALRPLVDGFASAVLYLAGRIKRSENWTERERKFYTGVDRTFLHRNPQMSVERWLHLAATHPQIAFAPAEVLEQLTRQEALQATKAA